MSNEKSILICELCSNKYSSKNALKRHQRMKHPEIVDEVRPSHICATCDQHFSSRVFLKSHISSAHRTSVRQQRILCAFENCNIRLNTYKKYYLHLLSIHHIEIKENKIVFSNYSDFLQWKENYESQHNVSFIRITGKQPRLVCSLYVEYYSCHRSYFPKITSGRRTKFKGSCKTGVCCPCKMKVTVRKNETVAYFTDTHLGHTCDPEKLTLNPKEKRNIAKKLSDGVPFKRILQDIKYSATNGPESELKRLHLTSRQDLNNICKEFNISAAVTKHQNVLFSPVNQHVEENVGLPPTENDINLYVSGTTENNLRLPQIIPTNNVEDMKSQILSKLHKAIDIFQRIQILPTQNEDTRQVNRALDNVLTIAGNLSENLTDTFISNEETL